MTVVAMGSAGIALLLIGALAARKEIAEARGLDRIVAFASVCFAAPLAVFGALHLFGPALVAPVVPEYMPWRTFWVYGVGFALIATSSSIATRTSVHWSGLLFGIMMFLFVAMIHLPGALREPHDRFIRTIVFREMAFGGAGWILAADAPAAWHGRGRTTLLAVGRALVTAALVVFGVETCLHPMGLPGVPLQREMPAWVPGRLLVGYLTGAGLLLAGASALLKKRARTVAAGLGGWLLAMVLLIYLPVLIVALRGADAGAKVEAINYLADTLLFTGAILALAKATPRSEVNE